MTELELQYQLAYMAAYARKLLRGSVAEFNALALVPKPFSNISRR